MSTYSSFKPGSAGVAQLFAGTDTAVNTNTGYVTVWNTSTLQSITARGSGTNQAITLLNTSSSIGTNSGALVVSGGVGIGGNLNVGGSLTSNGFQVLTTSSISNSAVISIRAGTDTAVSNTASGTVYIWNTSTLQSITSRGNSTPYSLTITSSTQSNSTNTGALVVSGGVGVGGNITVNGYVSATNVTYSNLLYGVTSKFVGTVTITAGVASVSTQTGSLVVANGGIGVGGQVNASSVKTNDNTTATINGVGSLQVVGGAYISNNLVVMGSANSSTTNTNALYVAGGVGIGGGLVVGGNTIFQGNAIFSGPVSQVAATSTYYTNNFIELHVPSAGSSSTWTFDDGKDIGIKFRYFNQSYANTNSTAALILAHDSNSLEWYSAGATGTNNIVNATYGTFKTGVIQLVNNSNSVNSYTGALQVAGGIASAQDIWVGGLVTIGNSLSVGTVATIQSAISSTTSVTGNALAITGGIGVGGSGYFVGPVSISSTNNSTSATNGQALLVTGGVGIGGNLVVNGTAKINGSTILTTASTIVANIIAGTDTAISVNINGTSTIWSTSTLQSVTQRGSTTTVGITISNTTLSTSTNSNQALIVKGGIGASAVYSSALYDSSNRVVTSVIPVAGKGISLTNVNTSGTNATFTITNSGVTSISPGTGMATSTQTGDVLIVNAGVLSLQGSPGQIEVNTSTGNIIISLPKGILFTTSTVQRLYISNNDPSFSTNTGALQVVGGIGVGSSAYIGSTATIVGRILRTGNVSGAGWSNSTDGISLAISPATYTETLTTGSFISQTVAVNSFGAPTLVNSAGNISYGDATNVYIDGGPNAGNNVSISKSWGLIVQNAGVKITSNDPSVTIGSGALVVSGGIGVGGNVIAGGTGQFSSGGVVLGSTLISSFTATTISTSQQNIDSYSASNYRTARYLIQVVSSSSVHVSEMTVFHDGVNVYKNEYGISTNNGELGNFSVDFSNGTVFLQFSANSTALTSITANRTLIAS
jgi:hypothetical protein